MDILIADDEPYVQRSLEFVLKKEGFEVVTAVNGEDALRKIREFKPKIVFLDLMMPKMNGVEACKEIKSDPSLRNIYVIILTAKGQEADRDMGLRAGADNYITKPFSPKEIVQMVRDIFERLSR
jgi:DNA-binding response OmpR family regulator